MKEEVIDILGREEFINNMVTMVKSIAKRRETCTFAIDGQWGSGKSFVLEKFQNVVQDRYLIINYNAWKNDFYEEPLVAFLSSIANDFNELYKSENTIKGVAKEVLKEVGNSILDIMGKISQHVSGINVETIVRESVRAGKKIKKARQGVEISRDFDDKMILKTAIDVICKELDKISKEITIIIIVDELDRCLPQYAIKVLERLHHINNNINNCQTILSVDKSKLNDSIAQIFGSGYVDHYLKKFIKFELRLGNGQFTDKYKQRIASYSSYFKDDKFIDDGDDVINTIMNGIDIRQRLNYIEKAELIHSTFMCPGDNAEKLDKWFMYFEIFWIIMIQEFKVNKDGLLHNTYSNNNFFTHCDKTAISKSSNLNAFNKNLLKVKFTAIQGSSGAIIKITNYFSLMLWAMCVLNTRYENEMRFEENGVDIPKNYFLDYEVKIKEYNKLVKMVR